MNYLISAHKHRSRLPVRQVAGESGRSAPHQELWTVALWNMAFDSDKWAKIIVFHQKAVKKNIVGKKTQIFLAGVYAVSQGWWAHTSEPLPSRTLNPAGLPLEEWIYQLVRENDSLERKRFSFAWDHLCVCVCVCVCVNGVHQNYEVVQSSLKIIWETLTSGCCWSRAHSMPRQWTSLWHQYAHGSSYERAFAVQTMRPLDEKMMTPSVWNWERPLLHAWYYRNKGF